MLGYVWPSLLTTLGMGNMAGRRGRGSYAHTYLYIYICVNICTYACMNGSTCKLCTLAGSEHDRQHRDRAGLPSVQTEAGGQRRQIRNM